MNKTYAVTDLHGRYDLWEQIKTIIDDRDTIYFLGDAIDRGPDGIKLIIDLLLDPRVIFIMGNHEEMMGQEARTMLEYYDTNSIWIANGGYTTFSDLMNCSPQCLDWLLAKIKRLPRYSKYINKKGQTIHLSHSGFDITNPEEIPNTILSFTENIYNHNRKHFLKDWSYSRPDEFMVHGHTPVFHLYKKLYGKYPEYMKEGCIPQIEKYCDGHKIDIDLASFATNTCALFDLDTFETIYITPDKIIKGDCKC